MILLALGLPFSLMAYVLFFPTAIALGQGLSFLEFVTVMIWMVCFVAVALYALLYPATAVFVVFCTIVGRRDIAQILITICWRYLIISLLVTAGYGFIFWLVAPTISW
ncbi:MAG: hypothetical protein AAF558_00665 [Verrucomicrobiota bacterium]